MSNRTSGTRLLICPDDSTPSIPQDIDTELTIVDDMLDNAMPCSSIVGVFLADGASRVLVLRDLEFSWMEADKE